LHLFCIKKVLFKNSHPWVETQNNLLPIGGSTDETLLEVCRKGWAMVLEAACA
jgi:hypothetical protein